MAYTTINKQTDFFNTKLYSGNASYGHAITGVGFQPDWVWIKRRDGSARNHELYDAVRGTDKAIYSSSTSSQSTGVNLLHSFDSDGFTVDDHAGINGNDSFVSWNWKANGAGSTNYNGSINSTVSVNTTAGFSIVKFVGTGVAGATVGHGLGVVPDMVIAKPLDRTEDWRVYHKTVSPSHNFTFNTNSARSSNTTIWNSTAPDANVVTLGSNTSPNPSGENVIMYCFASKTGFSRFNYYYGNFQNSGTFIYTGFAPQLVIVKKRDASGNWRMFDNVRDPLNPAEKWFNADSDASEGTDIQADLLSNGFKLRDQANAFNTDGSIYIYMAWGQSLVGSNNVPCTAR